jgi:YlmC/YmxH family sporulation protein
MGSEMAFCELRCKQVVNVIDGKVLGRVSDVVFSRHSSKVLGFVVPGCGGLGFKMFSRKDDLFIPFERICKIGMDVILVELKPFGIDKGVLEIEEQLKH